MKLLNEYVNVVQNKLIKLSYKISKKRGKKYRELSKKIDKNILDSYIFIEKMIDEELDKN